MLSKNKIWRKRVLLFIAALLLIAPLAFCTWTLFGQQFIYRSQMPVYPSAREVGTERTYEHAGTQAERHYFWTSASLDAVRIYYDKLTAPLAQSASGFDHKQRPTYRTVFNPYGGAIRVVTEEFGGEVLDGGKDLACYYRVAWECVEVYIVDYGENDAIDLDDFKTPSLGALQNTPAPLTIQGGRLIIYTYYVPGS